MARHALYQDEGPRLGAGLVLSFVAVVLATILAFVTLDDEFTGSAQAARMFVPQTPVAVAERTARPAPVGRLIPPEAFAALPNQSTAVDEMQTASVEAESAANLSCNVAACSQSYRSFRASDCTFQPFEGPRRLCQR